MKKYLRLLLLLPLFLAPYGLFADVTLTDEQAQELEATLDELETISQEQQKIIDDLKTQNNELKNQLTELKQQSNERENLLDSQKETLDEAKNASTRLAIFSVLRNILIAVISCGVGIIIGLFI